MRRAAKRGYASGIRGPSKSSWRAFAHDIRTPLTGILALSELLATSGLGQRERRWVAAIKDAAEHLAELTTLIVEGARVGVGRTAPRHDTFRSPGLSAALAASLAARAEAKNLACETAIAADLPEHVRGDAARLRTALENLMANAVKFTEHGQVGLKVEAAPRARGKLRLTFTVTDSGIGMSAAEIKRLFRPFAQANREIVQKFGGSGLGLVQVRRLAQGDARRPHGRERARARLDVSAHRHGRSRRAARGPRGRRRGRGAWRQGRACVEHPVRRGQSLRPGGDERDPDRARPSGRFRRQRRIRGRGGARGGPDVVLMDITLAGIDGFEATRRIRALPGTAATMPVIGISGRTGATDADAAIMAGMNAYLTKPVSPRVLADTLAKVQRAGAGRRRNPDQGKIQGRIA